jgi:hypothetical protein
MWWLTHTSSLAVYMSWLLNIAIVLIAERDHIKCILNIMDCRVNVMIDSHIYSLIVHISWLLECAIVLIVERDYIDCILIVIDCRVNVMSDTHIFIDCLYITIVGGCNCVDRGTRPHRLYIDCYWLLGKCDEWHTHIYWLFIYHDCWRLQLCWSWNATTYVIYWTLWIVG